MGLFDEFTGGLAKKLFGGGDHSQLFDSIRGLIDNPRTGGLSGIVQLLKDKGLGDAVSSWISTGKNMPVSADQIKNALGMDQVQQIAKKVGISHEEASNGLAALLPEIIDKLTPDGKLPQGDMVTQALNMLKNKFLGSA